MMLVLFKNTPLFRSL